MVRQGVSLWTGGAGKGGAAGLTEASYTRAAHRQAGGVGYGGKQMLWALFKPYGMLSQFTPDHPGQRTLGELGLAKNVYAIGRLDQDSEGLLLLSDEARWTDRLLNPRHAHGREYHVQVEGNISDEALRQLATGVLVQGKRTLPARARRLDPAPAWPPRDPPIRVRLTVPDSWLALELTEGRNRQVRRMTAAVGFPTLRLVRARIGRLELARLGLGPGEWRRLSAAEEKLVLA